MHELKLRVANYIWMEEMKILRTRFCTDFPPTDRTTNKPPTRTNSRPRELRRPQYSRYAP